MISKNSKIFLAGHKGMVGSSILRILKNRGYKKIITISKKSVDLRNQKSVNNFFKNYKPDAVIIAAAKVGGIKANMNYPADFITDIDTEPAKNKAVNIVLTKKILLNKGVLFFK